MAHTPTSGPARWATWLATLAAIIVYGALALLAASQLTACGAQPPAHHTNPVGGA